MRVRRTVLAVLITLALVTGFAAPARADGIGDKRREAAAIASRINSLEERIAQLGEDYDQALVEAGTLGREVSDAEARLAAKDAQLGGLEKQMASFALTRYTSSTDPNSLATLAGGRSLADGASQREGYAELALGANHDVSDEVSAAIEDTQRQRDALAAKRDRQAQLAQTASQKRQEAEDATGKLDATLRGVQADLAQLVQEEQQRQAAEAARKQQQKLAAAQAAADKAAADAAAAATKNTTPVKSGVGQAVTAPAAPKADSNGKGSGDTGGAPTPRPRAADPPSSPPPGTSAGAAIAVKAGLSQVGVPYQFGQSAPGVAFDCSGLTMYAWGQAGVSLPHSSRSQYDMLPHISLTALEPGDLVFSHTPVGHVGLYIGNGLMVHAPQPNDAVKVSPVSPNAIGAARPG